MPVPVPVPMPMPLPVPVPVPMHIAYVYVFACLCLMPMGICVSVSLCLCLCVSVSLSLSLSLSLHVLQPMISYAYMQLRLPSTHLTRVAHDVHMLGLLRHRAAAVVVKHLEGLPDDLLLEDPQRVLLEKHARAHGHLVFCASVDRVILHVQLHLSTNMSYKHPLSSDVALRMTLYSSHSSQICSRLRVD